MTRIVFFSLVAVMMAGCAPLGLYYQEGAAVSRMNSDVTDCQVSALNKVPVVQELRHTPVRVVPIQQCDAKGKNCIRDYEIVGGDPYSVDVNKDLRKKVEAQCMAGKGYQWVELPACSSSVASAAPKQATRVLPALSDKSCAINRGDGHWQIVTPG
ncbi:hypothetical protein TG4357_00369 [Thalassovita gelatinovora]|uniref:Lipoprotein n=1 Tax=Thalassovita gelatinovora TaxID=53501 RepID=A0A0P1F5A0_THAGE|nr:hypothetical protein [Thalassovita gelatinovora]QIZ79494.1 hypothetical protein HFZ77_02880 [Thalassovita gelatinovora]CUH62908.1 hypothetical protein TG4357_00369 [Thalassovita gelatinovora]SEQ12195.1 hypothetical protein SAMN04488043_103269 [Thalassovita gelatinovora]